MVARKLKEIETISGDLSNSTQNTKKIIFSSDHNGREIWAYRINNAIISSDSIHYPSIQIYSEVDGIQYLPIEEDIMSLKSMSKHVQTEISDRPSYKSTIENPFFFFIYNFDNYYHFIYDSLPYLITYFKLKNKFKNLKLLISSPNFQQIEPYLFFYEFLELLNISREDIIFAEKNILYSCILLSDSYTHSGKSEIPPREEIYELFVKLKDLANQKSSNINNIDNIYISRRTWIHENFENIGTNYTQKRKLENESELVEFLKTKGYVEIFTENISTVDKINIFANAKNIIGPSGGGLCNVLFCKNDTRLLAINSPGFMKVNGRFNYSFENVKAHFYDHGFHTDNGRFKKYMRVYLPHHNIVGEVESYNHGLVQINYTENIIAGWNAQLELKTIWVKEAQCETLDEGLNSPWKLDLDHFINYFKQSFYSS
jgi:hypothetical protein